jgi:hypothetical protein
MANGTEDKRSSTPVILGWGMPAEAREGFFDDAALWLTGGVSLLLWTALALLLTTA